MTSRKHLSLDRTAIKMPCGRILEPFRWREWPVSQCARMLSAGHYSPVFQVKVAVQLTCTQQGILQASLSQCALEADATTATCLHQYLLQLQYIANKYYTSHVDERSFIYSIPVVDSCWLVWSSGMSVMCNEIIITWIQKILIVYFTDNLKFNVHWMYMCTQRWESNAYV